MSPAIVSAGGRGGEPLEPPAWEIPGLVPIMRVVARSTDIVISVGPIEVYSAGVLVTFTVRFGPDREPGVADLQDELHRLFKQDRSAGGGRLMLGMRYGNGDAWRNVDESRAATSRSGPHVDLWAAQGRGPRWTLTYWVWPAPTGDTAIVAAWPGHGVAAAEVVITGADLEAARDAVEALG